MTEQEKMKPVYEKAQQRGRLNEVQYDYLKSLGFDMEKIERQEIQPARNTLINQAAEELRRIKVEA